MDEIFAERFWLLNLAYRFPLWPGSERVRLQLSWDYAQVDYLEGHALPRQGLRGLGVDLTIEFTDRITLILGYGYGLDAPRNRGLRRPRAQHPAGGQVLDRPGTPAGGAEERAAPTGCRPSRPRH